MPETSTPIPVAVAEPRSLAPPRRVVVIDDSTLVREAARVALSLVGWEVLVADSGEQGIVLVEAEQPDAVLLDVVMPGMDGIAVAEHLLQAPVTSASPVIMLTAQDPAEAEQRLRKAGVAGTIAKPFEAERLAGQVATLLGWPA
jgi:CheY-like chemotaxis protein